MPYRTLLELLMDTLGFRVTFGRFCPGADMVVDRCWPKGGIDVDAVTSSEKADVNNDVLGRS